MRPAVEISETASDRLLFAGAPVSQSDRLGARLWLVSETFDFWLVCAGGGLLLLALALVLYWWGDQELSTADILLGELHLGATYDAVVRGRLWRRMPLDIVVVPLAILAFTYAMTCGGYPMVLATAALYLAAWHRCRQNFGIARYYQNRLGQPVSSGHRLLFRAAVYVPMAAGIAYFAGTSPTHEGEEYVGLALPPAFLWFLGALAAASLSAYLAFAAGNRSSVHPGERWLVVANALAFASAYVLGAWSMSFVLVLALHHEVQYLCFTYTMARSASARNAAGRSAELSMLASFAVWPVIGLAAWAVCKFSDLAGLAPLLVGGLLCHYWLDSRIWTAQARGLARQ